MALVPQQLFPNLPLAHYMGLPEHELERRRYKIKTTLLFFDRQAFDASATEEARDELDAAVETLLGLWRIYRSIHCDRHIVPHSFASRFYHYQMRTYNLHLYKVGVVSVKNRICELDKFLMGPKNTVTGLREPPLSQNFPAVLLRCIAMFLLPSEEQHTPYYGYSGKSLGAQIDCTYEPPMINGQLCTTWELEEHENPVVVHADELLSDGWDAHSSDDEDWEDAEL